MTAPAFRFSDVSGTFSSAASVTGNDPPTAAQNDIIIAWLYVETAGALTVTKPAGWTDVFNGTTPTSTLTTSGSAYKSFTYWIRRGPAAPALTWSWTGSLFCGLLTGAYSGALADGDPFSFATSGVRDDKTARTYPDLSGTTATSDELVIYVGVGFDAQGQGTAPTGFTKDTAPFDALTHGTANILLSSKAQATMGATGTVTGASYATGSVNTTNAFLYGLKRAPRKLQNAGNRPGMFKPGNAR